MLTRQQKEQQVTDLSEKLKSASSVVFTNYRGVSLKDMEKLRKSLKKKNISFNVVKNSLLKRAFGLAGKELNDDMLTQPLAVAFGSEDEMAAPKEIVTFIKETDALEIAGGVFEGEVVDGATIKSIASLPGKDELYAKVVGSLASPLSRLVGSLRYSGGALTSVLKQRLDQIS